MTRITSLRGTKQSREQANFWIASSCLLAMTQSDNNGLK